ncbi:hypothetical protein EV356DRAFT_537856 [Viridothelium virens]|uniref:NACHT domain-containing protein n=1 Tax=Viridothelium virens TaxID=1048519 RepID=A0A6A6GT96_VIRVR|nr:hypothetical protein EV356DRAFT_537856 [Viridothelium virens]
MDPLSAMGVAGNIIAFVEFTSKLVSKAYEIYLSTARMTDEHADLANVIEDVHAVTRRLGSSAGPAVTDDEAALINLVNKCRKLSEDLIRALERLQTKKPMSKSESFHVAWRAMREKGNLESLEKRIGRYRRQILDRIVVMMSEDTSSMYKLLQQSMKTNEASALQSRKELQELRGKVLALVKKLRLDEVENQVGPENTIEPVRMPGARRASLVEVHNMLLRVTQVTATISREDWILNKLSFDEMHDRELSIEDAHAKTFRWLLCDPSDENPDKDARDEKTSSKVPKTEALGSKHGLDDPLKPESSPSELSPKDGSDFPKSSEASEAPKDDASQREVEEQEREERKKTRLKFLCWLNSGSGVFHIIGKLGSGKSTLMKFLSEEAHTKEQLRKWAGGKRLVFSQFFFWASGSPIQRSLEGLYRSILWEMLRECPGLMREVFPHCWDTDFNPKNDRLPDRPFSTSELVAAFELLIRSKTVFEKHKVCFFIDGLDEYDGDHWKLARSLQIWSDVDDLKICVSSRPHNEFIHTFTHPSQLLPLHGLTRQDIQKFVEDEFERDERFLSVCAHDKRYARLVESLVNKAEGVFLWVRLVMRELLTGMGNSYSISQLEEELDQLPEGLETLFRKLLTSIRRPDRMRAARTFLILTSELSFRDINRLVVVHAVIDELSDPHYNAELLYSAELGLPITGEDVGRMTHTMQDRLNSRCKGLIQISKRSAFVSNKLARLNFIHRSVYEFVTMHDVRADLKQTAGPSFDPAKFMCMASLRLLKGSYRLVETDQRAEPEENSSRFNAWDKEVAFGSYFWLLEKFAMPILMMTSQTETEASCRYLRELEAASELLMKLSTCLPTTPAPKVSVFLGELGCEQMAIKFLSDSNAVEAQGWAWLGLCTLFGARRFVLDRVSQCPELLRPSARIDLLLLASVGTRIRAMDLAVKHALEESLLEQGISPNWPLSDLPRCVPVMPPFPRFFEDHQTTWTMFLRLAATWLQSRHKIPEDYLAGIEAVCKSIEHYLEFGADPTVVFVGYQIVFPKEKPDGRSPGKHSEIVGPLYFDLGQLFEVWDPPSKQDLLALWDRKHQPLHKSWGMSLNLTRKFWQSISVSKIPRIDTESLRLSLFFTATVLSANDLPKMDVSDAKRWSRTSTVGEWVLGSNDVSFEKIWWIRI